MSRKQSSLNQGHEFAKQELKDMAYARLIKRAQRQLPAYDRPMSKLTHQPLVDTVSEALGRTLARPSGILGGGIVALLGSGAYYLLTRHYGYTYNFLVFVLLLASGFLLGWIVEIIWKLLKKLIPRKLTNSRK